MCGKAKRMNYSIDLLYLVVVVENNIECIFDFSTSCNPHCRKLKNKKQIFSLSSITLKARISFENRYKFINPASTKNKHSSKTRQNDNVMLK